MRKKSPFWVGLVLVAVLFTSACQILTPTREPAPPSPAGTRAVQSPTPSPTAEAAQPPVGEQPVRITGTFSYTNDIITTYYVEQAVALIDMFGFVQRDELWEIPLDSQSLGFMEIDPEARSAIYRLDLPAEPSGMFVDVDNDGQKDVGVQVFAVSYWPNQAGGPYSEGDDPSFGWPSYLASTVNDPENNDEVTGGKLVIWAPDGEQEFPTAFGEDGLLFTEDDPVGPVPPGYSVVDMGEGPAAPEASFEIIREKEPELTLYEPLDIAIKDYSNMTYTQAFDELVEQVRTEYAFKDIVEKTPDWDALYATLQPRIAEAEEAQDPQAFYLALSDFTNAFQDGHVGLNAGWLQDEIFAEQSAGGYGMVLRELDDGRVLVVYVLPDGPADRAGILKGAEVTAFNDKPIGEAISGVTPLAGPFSTDFPRRYQQVRYLMRAPLGTSATVTFSNPGTDPPQTVTLAAIAERESAEVSSIYRGYDANALPVEARILDSGAGYIKISSNNDDLNLIMRLFERALNTFESNQVPGVIIDLRQNLGGAPLKLAGFFTEEEIPLGQLEYFSSSTGRFEPEGPRERVLPFENQYRFGKMAVLVSQACSSACEIEAYAFSQLPGMIVVGETPSAGVEAEVARGQFILPEGMSMQVPTGRFTLPDGTIFLEGKGVEPTLRVPLTEENALSSADVVLIAAEEAVLLPDGFGITPSGPPTVASAEEARRFLEQGVPALEDRAREEYDRVSQAGETYTFTVALLESEPLLWLNGWCAADTDRLEENYQHITQEFFLNGEVIPREELASLDFPSAGNQCRYYYTVLDEWPAGEHHLEIRVTFDQPVNDGVTEYPQGTHVYRYDVYVKP